MSQRSSLEAALKTSGVTKSDVKKVIKNQLEDASQRKGGEKNANNANDRINMTNVD